MEVYNLKSKKTLILFSTSSQGTAALEHAVATIAKAKNKINVFLLFKL